MKKKRFSKVLFLLPVIMVALLLSSFTTVASAAEATADDIPLLRVENELAQAGETVVIEVKTENNPGILNALLTLSFDDELTLIDIQEGDALSKLDFTPPGKNSEGTYYSPCNFLWDAIDDADSTNGTILKLTFLLPEDEVPGTIYDIELSYVSGDIADGNLDPIEFDIINGYVEVLDYTPGDVNGDGRFNGTDITLLRRYITGGYGVSIDTRAADVNDDGRINGTDVTLIRRFITGGYGVELKPSHGCFEHNLVKVDAVQATCTVDGHIAYWQCSSCNKLYADAEGNNQISISDIVDEANGHTEVVDSAVAPTCTTTGLTEGKHCSVCNEVIVAQTVVPAKDHTVVTDSAVAATCTTTGLTEGKHCSVCKTVIIAQTVVPTIDHEYTAVVTSPNCLEKGYTTHTCYCGDSYIDSYVDALGHTEVVDSAVAATCTTTGLTEGKHCSVCHVVIIAQQKTDKLGHSMSKTEAKASDCTEDGNIAYWTCNRCHKYYSDANGNTEIALSDTVISAIGHTYSTAWQFNETHHYHLAICGCSAKSNETKHTLDSDGCCVVCDYESKIKLTTPVITKVEYDKVYWTAVENATNYTVTVNGDYTYVTASTNVSLTNVTYNGSAITTAGITSIVVRANGTGRYTTSDNSSAYEYYYVPEKTNLSSEEAALTHKGIGYGYNLIENEAINGEKISKNKILNIGKLLTLGEYYNPSITSGCFDSYHYSSVDELMAHLEGSVNANGGLDFANIAKLKVNYSYSTSANYSKYQYNEVLMLQDSILYKTYGIKDYNDEDLVHCLTEDFINDILLADSMGSDEWNEYMYTKYGTHVILGVATGGTYTVQYVVSTNKSEYAEKVKQAFSVNATDIALYSAILKGDLGIGVSLEDGKSWLSEDTEARFDIFWIGSTGGGVTSPNNIDSAISKFEDGLNESNAVIVRFTTDGAISIGSLISMVRSDLGAQFENYVSDKGDEEYQALYGQYTKPSTLPVSVDNVNGENVLHIDLSTYQTSGSLETAYNANLLEGVFTVYPKMMGKRIDKIVIKGKFDQYNENLIDGFSIKLADTWNRDVTIVIDNLGVVPASDKGFIDISKFNCDLTVEYTGINAIKVASDKIELYSSINGKAYNFTLKLNDGETIDLTTAQISSILTLPKANRNGYTFNGWRDGNGTLVTDEDGRMLSEYVLSSSMITLEATWIPKNYSITLNNEGATTQGSTTIKEQYEYIFTDEKGNEITSIVIPQKVGYSFEGYYLKVNNNNSSTASGETQIIDKNGKIIVDTGFFNENTTIYALWKPNKYVVTMVSNGTDFGRYYVVYGEGFYSNPDCTVSITKVSLPSRTGYTFNGFLNDNGEVIIKSDGLIASTVTNDYKTISSDISIDADWIANSYTIVYNSNGGTGTMASVSRHYDDGLSVGSNKFTRVGYTFQEWNTAKDGSGTRYSTTATNNLTAQNGATVTLYAIWTPITYTIEFDKNDGEGTMNPLPMTYDVAKNLTSNAFEAPYGKRFVGWKTKDGVSYGIEASVKNLTTEDGAVVVLYAQWTNDDFDVTFNPNNGTVSTTSKKVTYGGQYGTLPVPTRTGYTFKGWYNNGTLVEQTTEVTLGIIHELKAEWVANTYTVTYNANGGSGSMVPSTFTYDKEGTLSANAFTRNGWFFAGWDTKSDGTGDDYANKATIKNLTSTPNGNVILYAIWERETYEVTFDANGGSVGTNTKNVTFTYAYGDLPTPTREHYRFLGWYTQRTSGTLITDTTSVTTYSNHTLYAHWEQTAYPVTFNWYGGSEIIYTNSGTAANPPVINDVLFAGWDKDISNVTTSMTVNALYLNGTTQKATVSESLSISITPQTDKIVLNASTSNLTYSASVMGTGSNGMPSVTTHTASATAYIVVKQNGTTLARATSFDMKEISVVSGQTVTITLELSNSYSGSTPISASYSGNLIFTAMYNVSADRMVTNAALNTKTGSPAVSTSTTVSITPTSNKIIIVSANTSNLGYSISGLDTSGGWPQSVTYTASSVAAIIVVKQNGVEIARGTSLNSLELYVESGKEITITLELSHSSVPSVDMNPVETYSGSFNYTIMY